jgi:hypothetical protein
VKVYILWEHYKNMKWIVNIYLARKSAEEFVRKNGGKNDYRIEPHEVLG